jgi:hypothetical protein
VTEVRPIHHACRKRREGDFHPTQVTDPPNGDAAAARGRSGKDPRRSVAARPLRPRTFLDFTLQLHWLPIQTTEPVA